MDFLGPNGAGKSTTMNMITGFIEPTEGTIEVNGFDVQRQSAKAKRNKLGICQKEFLLYTELTVKEFVTYMAELKKKKRKKGKCRKKVLEETGLKDVSKKLIRNLSRGYKQRVSLAGALVGDPKVIY